MKSRNLKPRNGPKYFWNLNNQMQYRNLYKIIGQQSYCESLKEDWTRFSLEIPFKSLKDAGYTEVSFQELLQNFPNLVP